MSEQIRFKIEVLFLIASILAGCTPTTSPPTLTAHPPTATHTDTPTPLPTSTPTATPTETLVPTPPINEPEFPTIYRDGSLTEEQVDKIKAGENQQIEYQKMILGQWYGFWSRLEDAPFSPSVLGGSQLMYDYLPNPNDPNDICVVLRVGSEKYKDVYTLPAIALKGGMQGPPDGSVTDLEKSGLAPLRLNGGRDFLGCERGLPVRYEADEDENYSVVARIHLEDPSDLDEFGKWKGEIRVRVARAVSTNYNSEDKTGSLSRTPIPRTTLGDQAKWQINIGVNVEEIWEQYEPYSRIEDQGVNYQDEWTTWMIGSIILPDGVRREFLFFIGSPGKSITGGKFRHDGSGIIRSANEYEDIIGSLSSGSYVHVNVVYGLTNRSREVYEINKYYSSRAYPSSTSLAIQMSSANDSIVQYTVSVIQGDEPYSGLGLLPVWILLVITDDLTIDLPD